MKKLILFLVLMVATAAMAGPFIVSNNHGRDTRPLKDKVGGKEIGRISTKDFIECEPKIIKVNRGYVWHYATNKAGLRGVAVCNHVNVIEPPLPEPTPNPVPEPEPTPEPTPTKLTDSGPIVISGEQDVVINGLRISNPDGNCIQVQNASSRITIENSEIGPCGDIGIKIEGGSNYITVRNNYIHDTGLDAVLSYEAHHIEVDSNVIIDVYNGFNAWTTTEGHISFTKNFVKNVDGRSGGVNPVGYWGGNVAVLNFVSGEGVRITDNVAINIPGESSTEDIINVMQSHGTPADPILIARNKLNGGGPSTSSAGIIVGDQGGSYILVENNILVNPASGGIGIGGGHHMTARYNKIFSDDQRDFTNVGIGVLRFDYEGWGTKPGDCYSHTVEYNEVTYYQAANFNGSGITTPVLSPWYTSDVGFDGLAPNCGYIAGLDTNKFDYEDTPIEQRANLDASLWKPEWNTPAFLPQNPYWY